MIDFQTYTEQQLADAGRRSLIYLRAADRKRSIAAKCGAAMTLLGQLNRYAQDKTPPKTAAPQIDALTQLLGEIDAGIQELQALHAQLHAMQAGGDDGSPGSSD